MEMRGWTENFCQQKKGGCCLELRELPYYIEVFLEIPHNAASEKNLDVFIVPLLTNMCYKIIAKIKYEIVLSFDSYNNCNNKNSP